MDVATELFENDLITNNNENITELRKATVEEKKQLLNGQEHLENDTVITGLL